MNLPVLPSTAFLTALLFIGLFFFIRASTKDRIEVAQLTANEPENSLFERLQTYFDERAYRLVTVDKAQKQIVFEGVVRPSWFLAIFLSFLAAVGIGCLSLVLALLMPQIGYWFLGLTAFSPLAGFFYWKKSLRKEQVSFNVKSVEGESDRQLITLTAHRDELAEIQRALELTPLEAE